MACNNSSTSPSNFIYRSGSTSSSSIDNVQVQMPAIDSDGLENDTLFALSLLPKMEEERVLRRNEDGNSLHKGVVPSNAIFDDNSSGCVSVVQQAIDVVEPNDPQVHQLVFLVQQCVVRDGKHEVPEKDDQNYCHPCDVQDDVREHDEFSDRIEEDGPQQQEIGETELSDRMREVAIDFDDEDDSIGYRITEEIVQGLSNQDEVDAREYVDDRDTSTHRCDTEIEKLDELVKHAKLSAVSAQTTRLRVHPILTGNMTVKGICVPQLPRGRNGGHSSSDFDSANTSKPSNIHAKTARGSSRYKFRFSETEFLQLLEDEEANVESSPVLLNTYRRLSTNSKITVAVPLRRKSLTMMRNLPKSTGYGSLHVAGIATPEVARASAMPSVTKSTKQLWTARRKSTSACQIIAFNMSPSRRNSRLFSVTKHQNFTLNSKKKADTSPSKSLSGSPRLPSASSPPSPVPTTQTQMVLRVRERTSDGVSELVIAKKPVHFVTWHWNDRCVRVPFMSAANYMALGPVQHGIMLRQLRYVKLMMYELPWAKTHLRALLSKYTAKELSKEELYPQLNALGQQVQRDISLRARQQRALTAQRQRLTVTLKLATSVVNDTNIIKFGRRGRPHASRLRYDPKSPLQLHWRRKHGEWSAEYLAVDEIQVIEAHDSSRLIGGAGSFGRGSKKATAGSCLSFVTSTRSLDLQVVSSLHREWLANAVRDLVSFAQQYKATKANTATFSDNNN